MSVLDRDALEASPLADLHEIASELQIDGYRRLRREALIDAILERQGGDKGAEEAREEPPAKRRRGRRGGRGRAESQPEAAAEDAEDDAPSEEEEPTPSAPEEQMVE